MAYDEASHATVLFGGYGYPAGVHQGGAYLADTWSWNGRTWTRLYPAISPPSLIYASMAYDEATHTIVLFGGVDYTGYPIGETWTWNGTVWSQQFPVAAPPPLWNPSMAFDQATRTIVMFGGVGTDRNGNRYYGGTWTWDGTTWTRQLPTTSHRYAGAA